MSFLSPRTLIPNASRRKGWHDYSRKAFYLVTLIRNESYEPFSEGMDFNLTEAGQIFISALENWQETFPQIDITEKALLPDYIHLIIHIKESDCESLPSLVSSLKEEFASLTLQSEIINSLNQPSEYVAPFAGGFDERIIRRKSDLQVAADYVRSAKQRYLYLHNNRSFGNKSIVHCTGGRVFECLGNPLLLREIEISAVKVSSKYSPEELTARKQDWLRTILNGGVIVSPFVSGKELRVRDWALQNGGRIIQLLPNGFGDRFSTAPEIMRAISEGRMLLLAPVTFDPTQKRPSRSLCLEMNTTASEISAHTFLN